MVKAEEIKEPYYPEALPEANLSGFRKFQDTFNFEKLGRLNIRVKHHLDEAVRSFERSREAGDTFMLNTISHLLSAQDNLGTECGLDEAKKAEIFREKLGNDITLSLDPKYDLARGLRDAIERAVVANVPENPNYMTISLTRRFPRETLKQVSLLLSVVQRFHSGIEPFDVKKREDGEYRLGSLRTGVLKALQDLADRS